LGQIIVLVACEGDIADEAARKVQEIVNRFPQMHTLVIADAEAKLIQQRIEQIGLGDQSFKVGLESYGAIRNLGMMVATVLGFDSVVFLDDDEIVNDTEFLSKAMYGLGKLTRKGVPILVKSGYYINSEGSYFSMSQSKWYNRYWQQGRAFNRWITKAMDGPRLSRSNHVCGGILAIHREAFKRLSFDPWITRGEDLDYMLDLRMYGSDIWFDNTWWMRHLPPRTGNEGSRFRQDVYRWLYEYRKVEFGRTQSGLIPIPPTSLEPYPGPFLRPGITRRVRRTAFLRSLVRPNKSAYRKAARAATREAAAYARAHCEKYFAFQRIWSEIMRRVEGDRMLSAALMQKMRLGVPRVIADDELDAEVLFAEEAETDGASMPSFDTGMTSQVRLDADEGA
jgi:hypothetical protein